MMCQLLIFADMVFVLFSCRGLHLWVSSQAMTCKTPCLLSGNATYHHMGGDTMSTPSTMVRVNCWKHTVCLSGSRYLQLLRALGKESKGLNCYAANWNTIHDEVNVIITVIEIAVNIVLNCSCVVAFSSLFPPNFCVIPAFIKPVCTTCVCRRCKTHHIPEGKNQNMINVPQRPCVH